MANHLVASTSIILETASRLGLYTKTHPSPRTLGFFPYDGNLLGGALIGVGMAATGACPGTSMVQLGEGMGSGALVVFGGVLGAALFVKVGPGMLKAARSPESETTAIRSDSTACSSPPRVQPRSKSLDIPTALSLHPLTTLLLWIPLCLSIITLAKFLDSSYTSPLPSAGLLTPAYGGVLIGLAQAGTVLLTRHHIGASSAYEDLARWIGGKLSLGGKCFAEEPRPLMTPSMSFAAGIVVSAAILKHFLLGSHLAAAETSVLSAPSIVRTIAGGASMVFGARLAGGKSLTSRHGL